jgi:redox-sensitive bicupin YhaK (pirin superfamily)
MSAGTGIRHSESNASDVERLHLLQMWVPPDTRDLAPSYEQREVGDDVKTDELFPLASGREPDAAIRINQQGATLWIARLRPGGSVTVPAAPFVDVFLARGSVTMEAEGAGDLDAGDAVRLTDAGPRTFTARADEAELVVWETWSDLDLR